MTIPPHSITSGALPPAREATFARWAEAHQGILVKVARSHEADADNQQDLLQEMLLQLWRSIPGHTGQCAETTWIYRVALNTAFTWQRREKKRRERIADAAATLETAPPADSHAEIEARAQLEILYEAIRRLPRADAAIILMHLDGLTGREIAEVLGITENNAGVKLSRARKRLIEISKELSK